MRWKSGTLYVKGGVSILLLYYVFQKVGWGEVWNEFAGADVFYLVLYIGLGFVATLVSAIKWLVLSRPHGMHASLSRLVLLYMVGYFFNHILPTSVGGDLVRAYELGKYEGKKPEALASVFMERFTGYTILILFAVAAMGFDGRWRGDLRVLIPVAGAVACYVGIIWLVVSRSFVSWLEERAPTRIIGSLMRKIGKLQEAIYMYKDFKREMIWALGYSIAFYAISVMIVYVGCLTFATRVPLSSLLAAVPILLVLFMIPISVGGIGLQEWAYFFVLGMVGVPGGVGLSLGLLYRARAVAFGLVGGAIYPLLSEKGAAGPSGMFGKVRTMSE